ncbi:MAG: amidohydrolase family protein, partial [Pseudomonadota bacterium]
MTPPQTPHQTPRQTPPGTSPDLVIEGAHVVTPGTPDLADGRIVVTGGRIASVGPARGPTPTAAEVVDGRGLIALPGLVNIHTHAILTMVRGVAEDMGFAPAYTPGVPQGHMVREEEAVALARLGALEAMKFGSTLINDTYVHQHLTMPAMAETGIRVWACGRIHDVDFSGVSGGRWDYDPAIGRRTLDEALALHQRWHGAMGGRLGVQLAAHAPDTCSTAFLREVRAARDATGMTVTTHLAQSRIEVERIRDRDGLTPAELMDEVGLLGDRLIGAHCIFMTDDDIARAGRAGIHVAHIPKGNATGGTMAPTPRLRAAGANLCLSTDNMHADMVELMRWALAVGRLQQGRISEDWQPEDVLAMATVNGARAMGLGGEIGRLAPGMKADIVLIDARRPHFVPLLDPLGAVVHVGHGRDVRHVLVDGCLVVEDGAATLVDEAAIMRDAQAAAEALWTRARAGT